MLSGGVLGDMGTVPEYYKDTETDKIYFLVLNAKGSIELYPIPVHKTTLSSDTHMGIASTLKRHQASPPHTPHTP